MDFFKKLLKRLIPENIAGLLGVLGVVIPLARELVMVALRIIAVFIPRMKLAIIPVGKGFDIAMNIYNKIKNFFLQKEDE